MMNFNDVYHLATELQAQAKLIDQKRGMNHKPLFDEQLFYGQSKLLEPCVKETLKLISDLLAEQKANRLTAERTEFLCERIFAQMQALQREVATQGIRYKEPKPKAQFYKDIHQLRQEYAQHQEWERRLQAMVEAKIAELNNPTLNFGYKGTSKAQIEKELLHMEERHKRCVQAMQKLEKQINYQEQKEAR